VRKCGGYAALQGQGITASQGLNQQLERLRQVKEEHDRQQLLSDPEAAAMAKAYGASLRILKTDDEKARLLRQLKEFDAWASDARNLSTAEALEGAKFAERRQVQLQQQLDKLGGDKAYQQWVAEHPADAGPGATLEQKVAVLKSLKEYQHLGGEAAYRDRAAGTAGADVPLARKVAMLKAVLEATE
jgi:hypothetical protein